MSQGAATKGTLAGMTRMTNRQIISTSTQLSPHVGSFQRHIPLISKGRIQFFFDTSYFSPCLPFWTIFRSNQSHHVLMIKQDDNISFQPLYKRTLAGANSMAISCQIPSELLERFEEVAATPRWNDQHILGHQQSQPQGWYAPLHGSATEPSWCRALLTGSWGWWYLAQQGGQGAKMNELGKGRVHTQMFHGWSIYYIWLEFMVNVGKYSMHVTRHNDEI